MGTERKSEPDLNDKNWLPEELSAEVLRALKEMAENRENCVFDKVVVTVPALFELPQSKATANATRLAGFEKVELIPEPVASALASGWEEGKSDVAWLVYDLGGGTFDASLLESRDGLLRVVAHDGDNFLGGRDIDAAIVEWLKNQLTDQCGVRWVNDAEGYQSTLRHLEAESEAAKIRLSTTPQTIIEIETEFNGEELQCDVPLDQNQLEALCESQIQRSIDICLRLVESQGLSLDRLENVVLVGGPAHMPIIKKKVSQQLAPVVDPDSDPMSLVAKGAAIFSATMGLGCSSAKAESESKSIHQVWMQFPSVCSELQPTVMGRIIDEKLDIGSITLVSEAGGWESSPVEIDETGMFIIEASVKTGQKNSFSLKGITSGGELCQIIHPNIEIVHGLTVSDPPLSRSIGIALADGRVSSFIERGTPLPAKRTFTKSSVETLVPNSNQSLTIPIVQGERRKSRFCRNVGNLVIQSSDLKYTMQAGTKIEITIEVDRGGDMKAQAYLADQGKVIEGVAKLTMSHASIEELNATVHALVTRLDANIQLAFRERDEKKVIKLEPLSAQLSKLQMQLSNSGGDEDMLQRLSRNIMEIEAEVEQIENIEHVQQLVGEAEFTYFDAKSLVDDYGDDVDKRVLKDCAKTLERAMRQLRQGELERLIERLSDVRHSAHRKSPSFWQDLFEYYASFANQATNLKKAGKLVDSGWKLIQQNDTNGLRSIVEQLHPLIPKQYLADGKENYASGIY